MGSHDLFGHLKHKLWSKEGLGVKLTIWLPTTKSQESSWFPSMQVACHIPLESFRWRLQLYFRPHFNRRSTHKVMGPNVTGVPVVGISGLPLGSPETKWHLGVGPVTKHKVYYMGEGDGFPQVQAVVNLVNPNLLVIRPSTKNVLAMP
jgi:hypothetical protein